MTPFSKLEARMIYIVAAVWSLYVLALLLFLPPYWALMDDHGHIGLIPHLQQIGFLNWIREFIQGDFGWGMFRPVYAAYIFLFYTTFQHSSLLAYLFLYAVNVSIFLIWGLAFMRSMNEEKAPDRNLWPALFLILSFHFLRNNNLFYFASLQERLVILFLGISLWVAAKISTSESLGMAKQVGLMLGTLLSVALFVLSKAPAVSFVPLFVIWFVVLGVAQKEKRIISWAGALVLLLFALGMGSFFSSIRQGYTAGYRWDGVLKELSDRGSKFYRIFSLALFTITLSTIGWRHRKSKDAVSLYQAFIWPLGMMAYTAIMLPWQGFLNYYLIIPVGMFAVGTKLILFRESVYWLSQWKKLPYATIFIALITLTSITPMWKFYQKAIHHHGTGETVRYLKGRLEKEESGLVMRVAINCEETASAMGGFLGRPGSTPMIADDNPFYHTPLAAGEQKLLITHRECREFPDSFAPRREVFRYGEWAVFEQLNPS